MRWTRKKLEIAEAMALLRDWESLFAARPCGWAVLCEWFTWAYFRRWNRFWRVVESSLVYFAADENAPSAEYLEVLSALALRCGWRFPGRASELLRRLVEKKKLQELATAVVATTPAFETSWDRVGPMPVIENLERAEAVKIVMSMGEEVARAAVGALVSRGLDKIEAPILQTLLDLIAAIRKEACPVDGAEAIAAELSRRWRPSTPVTCGRC